MTNAKLHKRPKDLNQLSKLVVDIATNSIDLPPVEDTQNPHAVALGHLGGLKGGDARAASLSPEQRTEIARKAALARWNKK